MEKVLIGYYIGNNVQLDISCKKLISFDAKKRAVRYYVLRETMLRLFLYLLQNANGKIITSEELLYNVWDLHGLKSSSQRLWQVMQALKFRLASLGVDHDFIMRIETFEMKGHILKPDMIRPYYFTVNKNS
ncbi:hypothetical protein [Erwinia oleae]|uniref:hypothetical protein n=1 Tax=Erwinia oleae TaxID=796334 RepID=UPI000552489C|nr:hypothetical protein [Erwinia oleae]